MAPAAGTRPTIFVHGWTDDESALQSTGLVLTAQTDNRITPYYFNYGPNSTTWAGNEAVAGCLATYISTVSATYRASGGDGKVLMVGHSMGGLATLYAATRDGVSNDIGGLVTFDTPYLGSPFGNTDVAGIVQGWTQHGGSATLPPAGADAQVCLAPHSDGSPLPSTCHYGLPPYLPPSVPVAEIAGQVTVRRMLGPVHLYDISLDSDGIVPTESSNGYSSIEDRAHTPTGMHDTLSTDACTIDSDTLAHMAGTLNWPGGFQASFAEGAAEIFGDNNALDGLASGNITPGLAAYLLAATELAPCSHIHVYNDQSALNQATEALKADLDALAPPTEIRDIAPVTSRGTPAPGWTVNTQGMQSTFQIQCNLDGQSWPAPSAVTGNIWYCWPSAASADTCWRGNQYEAMLCLADPWSHSLLGYYDDKDPVPVTPQKTKYPIGLELANGMHCRLRNGGSWDYPKEHPSWVGAYGCGPGPNAVWTPRSTPTGIDQSHSQWRVWVGPSDGTLKSVPVNVAYYVTTAP